MADTSITGGRQLDELLRTLSVKVEKNILRSALRAGANEFKAAVKANIPVVEGALKASVRVTTKTKRGTIYAYLKSGGRKAPHAHLVEFGTRPHRIAPKGAGGLRIGSAFVGAVDHPGAKPHPFARTAFDEKPQQAIAAVAAQIRKRLTKEGLNAPAPEVP